MVVMVMKWNWYDGGHDDIAGREEEIVKVEVLVITELGSYVVGV